MALKYWLMLVGFGAALAFATANGSLTLQWINGSSDAGWTDGHEGDRVFVLRVTPDGPASSLHPQDTILAIDGRTDKRFSVRREFQFKPVGTRYSLLVERNGQKLTLPLKTQAFSKPFKAGTIAAIVVTPAIYFLCGFALFIFGYEIKEARLLAFALVWTIPDVPLFSLENVSHWIQFLILIGRPLTYLAFPLYLHFFLLFPIRSPLLNWNQFINHRRWLLYMPYLVTGLPASVVLTYMAIARPDNVFAWRESIVGYLVRYGVILVYVTSSVISLLIVRTRNSGIIRRRSSLLLVGILCGFLFTIGRSIFLFVLKALPWKWQSHVSQNTLDWLIILQCVAFPFMPVFFLYSVTSQKLIRVTKSMGRIAQYAVVTFGSQLVYVTLIAALLYIEIPRIARISSWWPSVLVIFLTALLVILLWKAFSRFNEAVIVPIVKRRSADLGYDLTQALPDFWSQAGAISKVGLARLPWPLGSPIIAALKKSLINAEHINEISVAACHAIHTLRPSARIILFLEEMSSGEFLPIEQIGCAPIEQLRTSLRFSGNSYTMERIHTGPVWRSGLFLARDRLLTDEIRTLALLNPSLLLPITSQKRMIGFLAISEARHAPDIWFDDLRVLKQIAKYAGESLARADWTELSTFPDLTDVLTRVIRAIVRNMKPAQKGSVYLWHENQQRLVLSAQFGYDQAWLRKLELCRGEGFAGRAFEEREPFIVEDFQSDKRGKNFGEAQVAGLRSAAFLPLQAWEQTFGVLCLDNLTSRNAFKERHRDRLRDFASLAAFNVQNVRVQEELQRLAIILNTSILNCDEVLHSTFASIANVTNVKAASLILLLDPYDPDLSISQTPLVSLAVGFSDDKEYRRVMKPRASGLGYEALTKNEPQSVSQPDGPPRVPPLAREEGVDAYACFPLEINRFVCGLLYLYYKSPHTVSRSELRALELFASQCGLGIANALQDEELMYTDRVVWMALLVSSIRHEMTQYINAINLSLGTIRNGLGGRPDLEEALGNARQQLINIERLQREDFTLPPEREPELINLADFLSSEVEAWCPSESGLECVVVNFCECEPMVSVMLEPFRLVVKNLTTNAVRAMQSYQQRDRSCKQILRVTVEIIGERVQALFENTGDPIPAPIIPRLFTDVIGQPGGQRIGVGLLLGRRIMRRQNGDLGLVKSNSEGTTFFLWLPLTSPSTGRTQSQTEDLTDE